MIREGTTVKWTWGQGTAKGTVKETYTSSITKTFKGEKVTRHGEANNKALLIEQEDGDQVLKLESEVQRSGGHDIQP